MDQATSTMTQTIALIAKTLQQNRTGVAPTSVSAVLNENTLVVTMEGALTPAEQALVRTTQGLAQVQEFHRQLFASSSDPMQQKIKTITGRDVREATAALDAGTGMITHTFRSGAMVHVYLLTPEIEACKSGDRASMERAGDDGFHPPAQDDRSDSAETD
ncbi:Na-translocating system protein MpsC family protein [Planctomycetes bacterium TBK1r]|uniref:Na+-translocating membrane potential-generating system MpsC domain-containing protein n=1 Tax=Stieleria magnilauensis TaxID=2527963 RepID=A0ABX5XT29_9BACT|nr:hypothetical protein TBK1r_34200 [Planctomycetes bacterium TBK1r]